MTLFGYDLGYLLGSPNQGATDNELSEYRELVVKWTGAFLGVGLLIVLGYGAGRPVGLVWAFACFAVGAAAGFVFGVPKSGQGTARRPTPTPAPAPTTATNPTHPVPPTLPSPTPPAPTAPVGAATAAPQGSGPSRFSVNTNLEEISDWATKIIIGLTLVQFREAVAYFRDAASLFAAGLGDSDANARLAFAQGAMVYFSVLGFLGCYLITRLFLAVALQLAENTDLARLEAAVKNVSTSVELVGQQLNSAARAIGAAPAPSDLARIEAAVNKVSAEVQAMGEKIDRAATVVVVPPIQE